MADQAFSQHSDPQQHRIAVAVGRSRNHLEPVAGGLTLGPKLVAGAAEKRDEAHLEGLLKGLAIHESEHEHFAAGRILHDGWQQPLHLVEIDLFLVNLFVHALSKLSAKNKKPAVANRVSGLN